MRLTLASLLQHCDVGDSLYNGINCIVGGSWIGRCAVGFVCFEFLYTTEIISKHRSCLLTT